MPVIDDKATKCYLLFLWIALIPDCWVILTSMNFGTCINNSRYNTTHILTCLENDASHSFATLILAIIFLFNVIFFSAMFLTIQINKRRQIANPVQENFITSS